MRMKIAEAWRAIMQLKHEPACLILSRQPLPTLDRAKYASAENTKFGGYVLADSAGPDGTLDVILIGYGL